MITPTAIIGALFCVIGTLLSIISFWVIRYIRKSDSREVKNDNRFDDIAKKIEEFLVEISVSNANFATKNKQCETINNVINKRLDIHSSKLEDHEKRLTKIEK
jgi:hypothetical protein